MLTKILDSLKLPEARDIQDLDHYSASEAHARIIQNKPFLKKVYQDFYKEFGRIMEAEPQGVFVEIGSGGGFLKKAYPRVITSDILKVRHVDVCCDALHLPFSEASVDGFFLLNVFHHIKDAALFLKEMERCLKPQGKIFMIEPANTAWARFIYRNFHHEAFDPAAGWTVQGSGPLSRSNSALPWIVFARDYKRFATEFPALKVQSCRPFMPFRYLLSGGLTLKALLPAGMYGFIRALEWVLSPLNRVTGMFFIINISKEKP